MSVAACCEAGDAEEVKVEGERHEDDGADQAGEGEQGQDAEMAEMGDALCAVNRPDAHERKKGSRRTSSAVGGAGKTGGASSIVCAGDSGSPVHSAGGAGTFSGARGSVEGPATSSAGEGILRLVRRWLGECVHARAGFLVLDFFAGRDGFDPASGCFRRESLKSTADPSAPSGRSDDALFSRTSDRNPPTSQKRDPLTSSVRAVVHPDFSARPVRDGRCWRCSSA